MTKKAVQQLSNYATTMGDCVVVMFNTHGTVSVFSRNDEDHGKDMTALGTLEGQGSCFDCAVRDFFDKD